MSRKEDFSESRCHEGVNGRSEWKFALDILGACYDERVCRCDETFVAKLWYDV